MLNAIVHRGPDEEGFLAAPPVVACSRRRSAIELPRGSQPIWDETGTLAVVFNRVIYEFRELRNELKANGHTIRTRCEVADQTSGAHQSASSNGCNQSKLRSRRLWLTPIIEVYARDRTNGSDPRQVAALDPSVALAGKIAGNARNRPPNTGRFYRPKSLGSQCSNDAF
jgi:hypothetical protein